MREIRVALKLDKTLDPQEQRYPFLPVCAVGFERAHVIMLMHAIAQEGCTDTRRVCAGTLLWEKNPLPH